MSRNWKKLYKLEKRRRQNAELLVADEFDGRCLAEERVRELTEQCERLQEALQRALLDEPKHE